MSDRRDFLEREELISNAACIGEDISLTEIGNAIANKRRTEYVPSDDFYFSHMDEKFSEQKRPDVLQRGEDKKEDERDDELHAFFENYHNRARTLETASHLPTYAALYARDLAQLGTTTTAHKNYDNTNSSSPSSRKSPVLETYLSRTERHELVTIGRRQAALLKGSS